jgi:ubiquinone/menaquinone biosynthesis C-methylase UbiE
MREHWQIWQERKTSMNSEPKGREEMRSGSELEERAEKILTKAGIKAGQSVLDCCCGEGNYTLAAAHIVGPEGRVSAVDRDATKLERLKKKISSAGIANVEIGEQDVGLKIPLEADSVDVVLLYDIFWYFKPGGDQIAYLLKEVYRVAAENALISVYPTHVSSDEIEQFKNEMEERNFSFEDEYAETLIHEGKIEESTLLHFRKKRAQRIRRVQEEIADLKARLPVHSVPPSMIQELEDLEEELDKLKGEEQEE